MWVDAGRRLGSLRLPRSWVRRGRDEPEGLSPAAIGAWVKCLDIYTDRRRKGTLRKDMRKGWFEAWREERRAKRGTRKHQRQAQRQLRFEAGR